MTLHALYRFFDDAGDLLYVGITLNPAARWKQHMADKPWWTDVANITVEPYPNRRSVLEAEALAIRTENPCHNVVGKPQQVVEVVQVRSPELVWYCTQCGESIAGDEGFVRLDHEDVHRYAEEVEEWDLKYGQNPVHTPAQYFEHPEPAQWLPVHEDCDPTPNISGYTIACNRVETFQDLAAWTSFLMSKSWLDQTNWQAILWGLAGDVPS